MLTTLLLSLAVTQYAVADDTGFSSPPMVQAPSLQRSARLVPPREARVSTGALVGRVGTSMALGLVGSMAGAAVFTGAVYLGLASGSYSGVLVGILAGIAVSPVVVGLGVLGVALGAALFGEHFGADFADAIKIAGITVPAAVAVSLLLMAVGLTPLIAIAIPFLAATISTPVFVQLGKPELARPRSMPTRPEGTGVSGAEGGLTMSF